MEWVGIGGENDTNPLEQVGTEQECLSGQYRSYGFYQFWPSQQNGSDFPFSFSAGDEISASVQFLNSSGYFGFQLRDLNSTSSRVYLVEHAADYSFNLKSAEWVVEAPTFGNTRHALPNFGLVEFKQCLAVVGNSTVSISNTLRTGFMLRPTWYICNGVKMATYSSINDKTAGFVVSWLNSGQCVTEQSG